MRKTAVAALAILAAVLAGCSDTHTNIEKSPANPTPSAVSLQSLTPAAATSTDTQEPGQEYLRIVGPANAALTAMAKGLASMPASVTGAEIARITDPAADAIDRADEQLLRVDWPATVAVDVKAMVIANAAVANDLRSIDGQDALSISAWGTQLAADSGKMAGTVAVVRADLGLPPASSASCGNAHCY